MNSLKSKLADVKNPTPSVLVVGQTPPPWHGQAVIIAQIVKGPFQQIHVHHTRMAFSAEHTEIGRVRMKKLAHLLGLIARIACARVRYKTRVLYYPPAGGSLVPVLRDIAILLSTRWMFQHVVFHFHAGGLSEFEVSLPRGLAPLFRAAYYGVDRAIVPSELNPADGQRLRAKETCVIPHGIADQYPPWAERAVSFRSQASRSPRILYVGTIRETKGILVFLEAARMLALEGLPFHAELVGSFESVSFETQVRLRIAQLGLGDRIRLAGVKTGDEKWAAYADADVFCFPTFYEAETFGLVALEAMQFELPVVGTSWRGLASIVEDGVTGLLVPPRDSDALGRALATLLRDPSRREAMGQRGRTRYLERFTLSRFLERIEETLLFEPQTNKYSESRLRHQDNSAPGV
jgi:glycosyltransferase involved in cell wall biosynthesis